MVLKMLYEFADNIENSVHNLITSKWIDIEDWNTNKAHIMMGTQKLQLPLFILPHINIHIRML